MKSLIASIIILFFASFALADAPPVVLKDGKEFYEIGLNLDILEDPTGKLTIDDVNSSEWEGKFKKSQDKIPNFGLSTSAFWLKIKIDNESKNKDWLFSYNYYNQDKITFFKKLNNKWKRKMTGDLFPLDTREKKVRPFIFKISPKKVMVYFFRIEGVDHQANISIMTEDKRQKVEFNDYIYFSFYLGVTLCLILYNLFIYISTRDKSYLYYTLYLFSFASFVSLDMGYSQVLIFKNYPFASNEGISFLVLMSNFLLIKLIKNYFNLKENLSLSKWLFWLSWFLFSCTLITLFIPFSISLNLAILGTILVVPSMLFTIFLQMKKRDRSAKYLMLAFFVFLIGGLIFSLMTTGFIPSYPIILNILPLSNAGQGILLSLGLADRFNLIQEENLKLQEKHAKELEIKNIQLEEDGEQAIKMYKEIQNLNSTLESKVKEKTHQIEIEKLSLEDMVDKFYEQKKDRDQLLGSLSQGYLTFNREGIIHEGATKITEDFLETSLFESEVKGLKIWDILFKEQNKKDNFKKWMDKVFEGNFSFKDLKELAPKSFQGKKVKHIQLDFRPIYQEDCKRKIDKVIMIASDKTHELKLQKQLEMDKENTQFITTCLQNPLDFVDLLDDSYNLLESYPIIKGEDQGELFRKFHTLKARYGQFGAKKLAYFINEIETNISKGQKDKLDFHVSRFDNELQIFIKNHRLIIEASNKFLADEGNAIHPNAMMEKIINSKSLEDLHIDIYNEYILASLKAKFNRYKNLVDEIAKGQGKAIDIEISGDEVKVDTNKYSNFISTSIHLFRNMVDHGIETEDERIEKTKPQRGSIKVEFKNNGDTFIIQMADDGGGIDPERIKNKVLEKGLKTKEDLENLKDSDLVDMIFLPGFSTKEEVTDFSGRGVGMDAVREEVERLGGTISVSSKVDEGTKFTIKLPVLS